MQYLVVTAKHHEGFALFDTKYDRYNCVTGAPFGRDLIAELAESCAKHNMKLGLYYSQELDKRLGFPGQRPQGLCAPV